MCGRYRLRRSWEQDMHGYLRLVIDKVDVDNLALTAGSEEARPTDPMPIVRLDDHGSLTAELRRWGYIIQVDGKTIDKTTGQPKRLRRDVHDRAPMVLLPDQYEAWLGGGESALRLVGVHPDADAFTVVPV